MRPAKRAPKRPAPHAVPAPITATKLLDHTPGPHTHTRTRKTGESGKFPVRYIAELMVYYQWFIGKKRGTNGKLS